MPRRLRPPTAEQARPRHGGIGRTSSELAERISDDLRLGHSAALTRRRRTAGLLLTSCASLGMVALYQFGALRHLPEPGLPWLDADRVDASGEAFQAGRTPDSALGIASYAASLALVGMGTAKRAQERPIVPLLAFAKLSLDAAGALGLTAEQITKHRALCSYCLVAAGASVAALPLALPEAREAWAHLRD